MKWKGLSPWLVQSGVKLTTLLLLLYALHKKEFVISALHFTADVAKVMLY